MKTLTEIQALPVIIKYERLNGYTFKGFSISPVDNHFYLFENSQGDLIRVLPLEVKQVVARFSQRFLEQEANKVLRAYKADMKQLDLLKGCYTLSINDYIKGAINEEELTTDCIDLLDDIKELKKEINRTVDIYNDYYHITGTQLARC